MAPGVVETMAPPGDDLAGKAPPDLVVPPKDIRGIIERTAGYVARNGIAFEDRIRQKESSNPKFSFLNTKDAYYPFYAWQIDEIKAGRGTKTSAGPIGEAQGRVSTPVKPKGPEPPPEFQFSARMPAINAQDLDIVRVTAALVAKNGRSFMTMLSQREASNAQFDFLRAQHSLYQYFSRLIDQYTELSRVDEKMKQNRTGELKHNLKDKYHLLGRAKQRAEWVKYQEQQKQKKEDEQEAERTAYAQIDWHDFVIVETVAFTEIDEESNLPAPTSINDLQSASLEQKAMTSLAPSSRRIEEAMPTDDEPQYYNQHPPQSFLPQRPLSQQAQPQSFMPPPQPFAPPPTANYSPAPPVGYPQYPAPAAPAPAPAPVLAPIKATPRGESMEEAAIRERYEARDSTANAQQMARASNAQQPMNIRTGYIPRAQRARQQAGGTLMCPHCKQMIPDNEFDEHLRIELLNPEWKKQQQTALDRNATTNLNTADVANNLKRLASQRTDVFDPVTGQKVDTAEEEARRKRVHAARYGQFDGVIGGEEGLDLGSGGPQGPRSGLTSAQDAQAQARMQQARDMNIEEQIRHIRQKAQQGST